MIQPGGHGPDERTPGARLDSAALVEGLMAAATKSPSPNADVAVGLRHALDRALSRCPRPLVGALREMAHDPTFPFRFEARDSRRFKLVAEFVADVRFVHVGVSFEGSTIHVRFEPHERGYRGSIRSIDADPKSAERAFALLESNWARVFEQASEARRKLNAWMIETEMAGGTGLTLAVHPERH